MPQRSKHVHGVGADSSKRSARHDESLLKLEMGRSSMTIRASNEPSLRKTEAIQRAKAFEETTNGMLNKSKIVQGVVSSQPSSVSLSGSSSSSNSTSGASSSQLSWHKPKLWKQQQTNNVRCAYRIRK
uniref:Uncharacterized protein n=1 Tax=Daphnia galeata TaxID=27404 RepID=A0A8J2RSV2_9CRUS|nr:unnamed protein product [Daphnia galeata]